MCIRDRLNILITGARGQLGSSLRQLGSVSPNNYLATDEMCIRDRVNVDVAAFPVLRDRVVAAQPEPFEQQHAEPLFGEPRCEF